MKTANYVIPDIKKKKITNSTRDIPIKQRNIKNIKKPNGTNQTQRHLRYKRRINLYIIETHVLQTREASITLN